MRKHVADGSVEKVDAVAIEHYLAVEFGGEAMATLACTPAHLEELVAGFLLSQGLLPASARPEEVGWRCEFSADRRVAKAAAAGLGDEPRTVAPSAGGLPLEDGRFVASGCGAGLVKDQTRVWLETPRVAWDGRVAASDLGLLAARLDDAPLFHLTGGAHSALAGEARQGDATTVLIVREDIGRHNAVDKVVGHLWLAERLHGLSGTPQAPARILATSGRISSDVVLKAARAGFPVIVSHGAATVMAVEMARQLGLTLVGFARARRLNVYTHCGRVRS